MTEKELAALLGSIASSVDRLTQTVSVLASTVVAHDGQIESLIAIAEKHTTHIAAHTTQIGALTAEIAALAETAKQQATSMLALERQWQAYINTLPRQ